MQSVEAVISLMVLVMICSAMLAGYVESPPIDDSLYRYQLANDVWRVLSLKGDFKDFDFSNSKADDARGHLTEIYALTGLCGYLGGIRVTSCPGEDATFRVASINRVLYEGRIQKNVTLMLAKPQ